MRVTIPRCALVVALLAIASCRLESRSITPPYLRARPIKYSTKASGTMYLVGARMSVLTCTLPQPRGRDSNPKKFEYGAMCVRCSPILIRQLPLMTAANAAKLSYNPFILLVGAPEGIRTPDLCLRRAALYPAELRAPRTRTSPVNSETAPRGNGRRPCRSRRGP